MMHDVMMMKNLIRVSSLESRPKIHIKPRGRVGKNSESFCFVLLFSTPLTRLYTTSIKMGIDCVAKTAFVAFKRHATDILPWVHVIDATDSLETTEAS
jgi:hypothetical protein